jgi:hypothetical protein
MTTPLTTEQYEDEVRAERARQDVKWGQRNHPDGTGPNPSGFFTFRDDYVEAARTECDRSFVRGRGSWRHILAEEVAEAFAEADPLKLRAELVQVEAVARAWREAIDRREARPDGAA